MGKSTREEYDSSKTNFLSSIWPPKINRVLVPLKMTLFLWHGGMQGAYSFYILFFEQRGLNVKQLSFINMVIPFFEGFGPVLSGIVADKIGRSKPVLIGNLLLLLLSIIGFLFVPHINVSPKTDVILPSCFSNITESPTRNFSELAAKESVLNGCTLRCQPCVLNDTSCENVSLKFEHKNIEDIKRVKENYKTNGSLTISTNKSLSTLCRFALPLGCSVICNNSVQNEKSNLNDNTNLVFFTSLFLLILFNASATCIFAFLDITAMSMVKAHNGDFGRERFWSISGNIAITALVGYLVQVTSIAGPKNYSMAFYSLAVCLSLMFLTIFNLDVKIEQPGKKMLKKNIKLLKNPDVLTFFIIVFVLGTIWAFRNIFSPIFLDELGASSMLLALLPVIGNILGLPFLITSNWWIERVGSTNIFLLALVTYAIMCTAYSFLWNPWLALVCEIGVIFTYHLLWVGVIRHSHNIAPEGLVATVLSTSATIHWAFSKLTASLTGGLIMSKYGARFAYRIIAVMSVMAAIFYAIFLRLRRKYKQELEIHEMYEKRGFLNSRKEQDIH